MHVLPLLLAAGAPAAQDAPSAPIARLPAGVERPAVDGVFDDPAWEHASLLGPLTQVEPVAGAEPSERTEVRLLHDAEGIFLAISCFDEDPSAIRATQMLRDARLDPDDRVEFYFDPFLDRRNAFWFQIGPAGSRGDALITKNGSSFNKDFDAIWYGRARITPEGWVAEVEIPVASLNFDPAGGAWGFNLRRLIRRRSEEARWASPEPRHSFFSVSQAGTLEGFGALDQGLGLDVTPFVVGDWFTDRETDDTEFEEDVGLDAFYKLTPNSKLSVSVNTDFAETEVDERIVNLTRFPVFFPEKRDFFLEDSGNFFFGPSAGRGQRADVIPFFSRRIGLDGDGNEVPLLAAAKLTGATDSYSYGVLDVQTDSTSVLDDENLFAGRFSKNLFEQSDVGVIATAGDPEGGDRNATYGADLNLRTDEFLGDRNLRFSTYVVKTDSDDTSRQNLAYHASISYPNDEIDLSAGATVIERNFDPALGFVQRTDVKKYTTQLRYQPRLYTGIRQLEFLFRPTLFTDAGNNTETVDVLVRPLGIEWESGDELRIDYIHEREVLTEEFDIQDDVIIPEGSYTYDRVGANLETSSKRPVSVEVGWFTGGFFDGRRDDVEVEADWRPDPHLVLGGEYELNDVRLPGGDFRVHTARLRVNVLFSPEISWSNFIQYDNVSDDLGLNSRFRWILSPGRELNFVVNQGWEFDPPEFESNTTQLTLKVSYTLRF